MFFWNHQAVQKQSLMNLYVRDLPPRDHQRRASRWRCRQTEVCNCSTCLPEDQVECKCDFDAVLAANKSKLPGTKCSK